MYSLWFNKILIAIFFCDARTRKRFEHFVKWSYINTFLFYISSLMVILCGFVGMRQVRWKEREKGINTKKQKLFF